ncbi:hypothetical protein IGI04_012324 [Brassica rapa subsp. trilocularis]|uniref:Reverse transcriptase zinc-binding domain-containing protein n=1 Tax=Brassica rapa subsp. trilocularis TaxID=1813537 RepID=A0ABQ7N5M7_BRACM|nr:hypothetical protein IGI04_012324 [Brassica rapa subsp. trilocularis]
MIDRCTSCIIDRCRDAKRATWFQPTLGNVYLIWRERNACRHRISWMGTEHMSRLIDRTIRNRILALKYGTAHNSKGLLQRWLAIYD